ncbi:hypothetical protein [Aquella oligotrophica]|uniref:hypothetical protein n=1 Tax=Aquella oligotrophica TaxID=2067065 RepID=UPI0013158777|nr:hypothetical protein [Aquella oligotrophica]
MKTFGVIISLVISITTLIACTDSNVNSLQQIINASNSAKASTSGLNKSINIDANKERV